MARLGDEAGNDLAAATGHYATISNILSGKALGTSGAGTSELPTLSYVTSLETQLSRWNCLSNIPSP